MVQCGLFSGVFVFLDLFFVFFFLLFFLFLFSLFFWGGGGGCLCFSSFLLEGVVGPISHFLLLPFWLGLNIQGKYHQINQSLFFINHASKNENEHLSLMQRRDCFHTKNQHLIIKINTCL